MSHTVVCHTVVCHTVWCVTLWYVTHCGVSHTVVCHTLWCGVSHRAKMRICSVVRLLITMRIAQNTTESLISAVYGTCINKGRIAAVCCGCGVACVDCCGVSQSWKMDLCSPCCLTIDKVAALVESMRPAASMNEVWNNWDMYRRM